MNFKIFLSLTLVLSGALSGCSTFKDSDATEWLPTIGVPLPLPESEYERQQILKKCGLAASEQIWVRHMDVNRDGKEDSVVTIALPEEIGAYWRNQRSLTYVLPGEYDGAFTGNWERTTIWFSLVTYEGQTHVRYGDSETIRQFSVFRRKGVWYVHVREQEYESGAGEASERNMQYQGFGNRPSCSEGQPIGPRHEKRASS